MRACESVTRFGFRVGVRPVVRDGSWARRAGRIIGGCTYDPWHLIRKFYLCYRISNLMRAMHEDQKFLFLAKRDLIPFNAW